MQYCASFNFLNFNFAHLIFAPVAKANLTLIQCASALNLKLFKVPTINIVQESVIIKDRGKKKTHTHTNL